MNLLGIESVPITITKDYDQTGHFRYLQAGAGSNTFKITDQGVAIGGEDFSSSGTALGFDGTIQIRDTSGNVVVLIDPNG